MTELLKTFDLNLEDLKMIFVWAVCFVAIWQLLARTLFGPYIKLAEEREAVTTGAEINAKEQNKLADELTAQFEDRMTVARVNAMKIKLAALNKARTEAQGIIEKAESGAQDKLKTNRDQLKVRLDAMRKDLERECDNMVAMITEKVKGGSRPNI